VIITGSALPPSLRRNKHTKTERKKTDRQGEKEINEDRK
jgi:hypothetical protein